MASVVLSAGLIILVSAIPLQIAITLHQVPQPQAILVLGGDIYRRIPFVANFAQEHPELPLIVSDYPSVYEYSSQVFREAGIAKTRIDYDFCATDTVTNFTCTVTEIAERDLRHLYLVTTDYHMRRAVAIATVVLGSRGIVVTPVAISSNSQPESWWRVLRDSLRSVLWLATGKTGASLNPHLDQ